MPPLREARVKVQSDLVKLIYYAKIIIWDEAPMGHRFLLESLDRSLRDIMKYQSEQNGDIYLDLPFGGKVIVLSGDFRQVLPVLKHGSQAQICGICIKRSPLWKLFKVHRLDENMRVLQNGNDESLKVFDEWLVNLGNGDLPLLFGTDDFIELPTEMCMNIDNSSPNKLSESMRQLVDVVFPNLSNRQYDYKWVSERAILAPNVQANMISDIASDMFPGNVVTCTTI